MTSKLIGNLKDFTSKWHYLKEEVDNKLKLKSDVGHTHSDDDVTVTTTNYGSGLNQNNFNSYLSHDMIQVKNKVDSVVHTSIALDKYNCSVGDTVTVTVTCTDSAGAVVANRDVTLYVNGSSVNSGKTNTDGVVSFTYTTTDKGIIDFQVDNTHMYCNVESKVITVNGTNYILKILDNLIQLEVSTETKTYNTGKTVIETISSKYCPSTLRMIPLIYTADVIMYVTNSGEITFENRTSSSFKATLITSTEWYTL